MFDGLKVISNESNGFDDPKEFDDPLVFDDPKKVSIGTMDFCILEVNGDTSFFDGKGTSMICKVKDKVKDAVKDTVKDKYV